MKARFVLLALGLALAGCANVKDIRDREPAFYGSPQRSAQEYAACVSAAWKGLGVPVEQREIRNGYELVSRGSLGVDAVLTTTTWQGKTDASLSTRLPQSGQQLVDAANLCL
ncbi:hypothetical protein [Bordetella genomosp. 6]|uniref:hypothetical protein n=1 Tax=Bordetella genomosp. 6 TaxID=463024 RepID=UPI000A28E18B|nr:hypothetical protein [Bordetella genomosp. 6]ARP77772.1 hypothetical protein CAL11_17255 [Bordetella genomosp. 6]MBN3268658.1 hypothetical protein [Bordetella bronchiseptica]